MKNFLDKRYIQIIIAITVGIGIGVIFYPTKHIENRIKEVHKEHIQSITSIYNSETKRLSQYIDTLQQSNNEYKEQTSSKINFYEQQIQELKSKVVEKTYKIVKPDGTIIEKTFKESETEEYNSYVKSIQEEFERKITLIENKWLRVHETRVENIRNEHKKEIQNIHNTYKAKEQETIIDVNKRRYITEIGYSSSKEIYMHTSYSLWGPVILGSHFSINPENYNVFSGLGIGLSF